MTSFKARPSVAIVGALYSCACSGAAPEAADAKPSPDTYPASAQVSCTCSSSHQEIVDLGSLDPTPSIDYSVGLALNALGTVVGDSSVQGCPSGKTTHAFRWKAETGMVDLGGLDGNSSEAFGVNDQDEVVGNAATADGVTHAVVWDAENRVHELPTLGGPGSYARNINNRGQVVGAAEDAAGVKHPVIWDLKTGTVHDVNLPGSTLIDLNDSGVVIGTWAKSNGTRVPMKWTEQDGPTELSGTVLAINNQGEIAGYVGGRTGNVGVKWTASGTAVSLPPLPNSRETTPWDINDLGALVGGVSTGPYTAAQWDPTLRVSAIPLQTQYSTAVGINNCGDVTGTRSVKSAMHAYLWHPERAAQ